MFVPAPYRAPDGTWIAELMRDHPLALMTSNGPDGPHATHLPIIPAPGGEPAPNEEGSVLWGHMNRANPHWKALRDNAQVLVVFTGPNAYVSPSVYRTSPAAPTWNFTAAHVRGVIQKIDSPDETLEVVRSTVRTFEAAFGTGWDMTGSMDYFHRILPAVGAFRLTVVRAEGMFKLSQEQESEVRERVRSSFAQCGQGAHQEVAAMMSRLVYPASAP